MEPFLVGAQDELAAHRYRPLRNRRQEIPKGDGKVRVLGIPCIRDRVVQEPSSSFWKPIFEADFNRDRLATGPSGQLIKRYNGSPKPSSSARRVVDIDLRAYFDNVRQYDLLLQKVAVRVSDAHVLHLLKLMLKASGKKGVPQGGDLPAAQ